MKLFYVYQLRAEGYVLPFYIGKGTGNRLNKHFNACNLKKGTYRSDKIKHLQKNGIGIAREKLYESTCEISCLEMEVILIALYGRKDNGTGILTNHTDGGDGISGLKMSDISKEKMRDAKIGKPSKKRGIPLSDEQKSKMRFYPKGMTPHNKGIKQAPTSELTKNKMRVSQAKRIMEGRGNIKYSRRMAADYVKIFKLSGQTKLLFCKNNNLPTTTFSNWMRSKIVLEILNDEGFTI